MKINRTELLGLLKRLAPAVASSKNVVAELSCVWFSGTHASAFNDVLGIQVEFPTEFTGGVLGEKLMGVLERSRAKEVDVEVDQENALFKIGAARIKMTCRPIEDWFWKPELPDDAGYKMTDPFRNAVSAVLLSVGSSSVLNAEQRGITVIQGSSRADLYSTDAVSMSWVRVDTKADAVFSSLNHERVIIPTPFCEELKSLKGEAELRFDDGAVYCSTSVALGPVQKDEGGVKPSVREMLLFSKLVGDDDPVPFADVVGEHLLGSTGDGVEIPNQLKLRAERAMVMVSDQPVDLEVEDGHLYLYAQTPYGEVDDVMKIAEDHPNIKVKIDIDLVRRALDSCDRMTVGKSGVVMRGSGNFLYIAATK